MLRNLVLLLTLLLPTRGLTVEKRIKTGIESKNTITRREEAPKYHDRESIEEDFSKNIELYLFEPAKLKATNPAVYNWIRRKYGAKFKLRKPD